jgi:hypothetical protein
MTEHFYKCVNAQIWFEFAVHISTVVAIKTIAGRWNKQAHLKCPWLLPFQDWWRQGFSKQNCRSVLDSMDNTQIRVGDLAKLAVNVVARKCEHWFQRLVQVIPAPSYLVSYW